MPDTITQALVARYANGPVADFEASGGLWFDEMPDGASLPFLLFAHQGEQAEFTTEKGYLESGSHEFHVFAETVAETERLALAVRDVFDPCIESPSLLSVTGAVVFEFARPSYRIAAEGQRSSNQKQVGHASFVYSYGVRRMLPA
jgi:hypothetical protein